MKLKIRKKLNVYKESHLKIWIKIKIKILEIEKQLKLDM